MRALLDRLREDLGIPESDGEGEEDFGLKSHVKMSDEVYHRDTEQLKPKSHVRMSDEVDYREMEPPKPQPRAQGRNKFVKVTDKVDYKSPRGGELGNTGSVKKQATVSISRKLENVNISQPSMSPEHWPSTPPENGVVSDAIEEEDYMQESEKNSVMSEQEGDFMQGSEKNSVMSEQEGDFMQGSEKNSVMSEQEGSVTSNVDDLSMTRSLPQEHKWMKNASNFTMTLKPGQLDMTLVKPKPRSRDRQRLAETVPANPRARRRELAQRNEEKQDDLGTTGEMSTLTEVTAMGESEPYKEDQFEVSSVASDATLKNEYEKGSQQGSNPGSPRSSAHGSSVSLRFRGKPNENGSVKGSRHASPRGSTHGSTRGSTHGSTRGSIHGSTASGKVSNQAHEGLVSEQGSEQGSSGTLQGSLEGSTTFVMAQTMHSAPQESPRPSRRARAQPSPRGNVQGSPASVHSAESGSVKYFPVENESLKNEATDTDSVFSDHLAGPDSEPEKSPKAGRAAPSYAKKTPNYDGDDDDDF
jgi:CCR4-NOT transcription complex subunit 1